MAYEEEGNPFAVLWQPAFNLPAALCSNFSSELSQKFCSVVTTASLDLRETLAIALIQLTAVASGLKTKGIAGPLPIASDLPDDINLLESTLYDANSALVKQVCGMLPAYKTVEEFLRATAQKFRVRVCHYMLRGGRQLSRQCYECDRDKYFSCYIFEHDRRAVLLVPKKYFIALRSTNQAFRKSVFIPDRRLDPPKEDPSLQASLQLRAELLKLMQDFSTPLLKYCERLLARQAEFQRPVGAQLTVAMNNIADVIDKMQEGDFGNGGEALMKSLRKLLKQRESAPLCIDCGRVTHDVTLDCGHLFCASCIKKLLPSNFLNVRGELTTRIRCPYYCRGEITVQNLKAMDTAFFEVELRKREEECSLKLCLLCHEFHTLGTFQVLGCGHSVCKYCLAVKHSSSLTCPTCHQGAFQLNLIPESLKSTCVWCSNEFRFKFTLGYTCVISSSDGQISPCHNEYCNSCLYYSLIIGKCCDNHEFSENEKERFNENLLMLAECHQGMVPAGQLLRQVSCLHCICTKCVVKSGNLTCMKCQEKFDEATCANLPVCVACSKPIGELELPCSHRLHKACVKSLINSCKYMNHASCPMCQQYIPPSDILSKITDQQIFHSFSDLFGYSFNFICPRGSRNSEKLSPIDGNQFWHKCHCHGLTWCPFCAQQKTEDSHTCPYVERRKNIDNMLTMGHDVIQCPFCEMPTKKISAEYAQCQDCQNWYYSCCAAPAAGIYYHGKAWHRPNCLQFADEPENQMMALNCPCYSTGVHCPRPARLLRHCLFAPGMQ